MEFFKYHSTADFITPEFNAYLIKVTPKMAEDFLGCSIGNRKLSTDNKNALKRDMTDGLYDFKTPGSGIAFNTEGKLVNGHHTLAALKESGTTQTMVVFTGVEKVNNIDVGKSRTLMESLCMSEDAHLDKIGKLIANILRIHTGHNLTNSSKKKDVNLSEVRKFGNEHYKELMDIYNMDKLQKKTRLVYQSYPKSETSVIGSIIYELVYDEGNDFGLVTDFIYGIVKNETFGVSIVDKFRMEVYRDSARTSKKHTGMARAWTFEEFRAKAKEHFYKYKKFMESNQAERNAAVCTATSR